MILSILPVQVSIEVLSNWCSPKDLNEFDSAACNISFRKVFLHMIDYPLFVVPTQPEGSSLHWMSTRKIKFVRFGCTLTNLEALGKLDLDTSKVQQINISGPDNEIRTPSKSTDESLLLQLINKCPNLLTLDLVYVDCVIDNVICQIKSDILAQLTHLTIHNQSFDFTIFSIRYFSRCCRNLVSFQFQAGGWGPDLSIKNEYFINLIKTNPQLKHIKIRQESHATTTPSDCFLPIIAQFCPEVESVEFGSDFLYTVQNIANLLQICTNLAFLSLTSHSADSYGFEYTIDKRSEKLRINPLISRSLIVIGRDTKWTEETYILSLLKAIPNGLDSLILGDECSAGLLNQLAEHFPDLNTLSMEYCQIDETVVLLTKVLKSCKKLHYLSLKGFDCDILQSFEVEPNAIKHLTLESITGLTTDLFCTYIDQWSVLHKTLEKITVFESDILMEIEYSLIRRTQRDSNSKIILEWKPKSEDEFEEFEEDWGGEFDDEEDGEEEDDDEDEDEDGVEMEDEEGM